MRGAQDKLVADIPRKTKTATTNTSVVVNLRLGGEPFFSSSSGISQTTEKKRKAAKEAEDDGKFIHAVKRIAAEDREEGEEEVAEHGGVGQEGGEVEEGEEEEIVEESVWKCARVISESQLPVFIGLINHAEIE